VSMRAGALAFRDDLGIAQVRSESSVIRDAANEALRELRTVLHVLRDPTTGDLVEQPQPTFRDIAMLIERARDEGAPIEFVDATTDAPSVEIGRTMYRVIQEGITNASKHAPGSLLRVSLTADEDDGVVISMTNPCGLGSTGAPGAGLGLLGIAERVAVARGRFATTESAGEFRLRVWLPSST
jgi:signal transduction histidine kinase